MTLDWTKDVFLMDGDERHLLLASFETGEEPYCKLCIWRHGRNRISQNTFTIDGRVYQNDAPILTNTPPPIAREVELEKTVADQAGEIKGLKIALDLSEVGRQSARDALAIARQDLAALQPKADEPKHPELVEVDYTGLVETMEGIKAVACGPNVDGRFLVSWINPHGLGWTGYLDQHGRDHRGARQLVRNVPGQRVVWINAYADGRTGGTFTTDAAARNAAASDCTGQHRLVYRGE